MDELTEEEKQKKIEELKTKVEEQQKTYQESKMDLFYSRLDFCIATIQEKLWTTIYDKTEIPTRNDEIHYAKELISTTLGFKKKDQKKVCVSL